MCQWLSQDYPKQSSYTEALSEKIQHTTAIMKTANTQVPIPPLLYETQSALEQIWTVSTMNTNNRNLLLYRFSLQLQCSSHKGSYTVRQTAATSQGRTRATTSWSIGTTALLWHMSEICVMTLLLPSLTPVSPPSLYLKFQHIQYGGKCLSVDNGRVMRKASHNGWLNVVSRAIYNLQNNKKNQVPISIQLSISVGKEWSDSYSWEIRNGRPDSLRSITHVH